jgi:uncharacterized protein involved in exopolysaccharide biosynthesis
MTNFRPRTITEYLQIIWRRKLLFFLIASAMLISTFLIVDQLPNVYEARATVVTASGLNDRQTVNARVAATTERLTSRAFLEPVISRNDPYENNANIDASIARIRQDLKVDTIYRNDYPERLTIAYRHTDPAVAKAIAVELVSAFGNMNEAMAKQAAESASMLATQIVEVENRLREMGKLRAAIAARQSASGRAAGSANAIRAQRIAAASSIETLSDKQFSLEQQIAEQKRQIEEQEKIARLAPSDAKSGGSYGVLLVRKAELEAQMKDYGTQYTDKNPKVIQTRNQLGEINHQIAQLSAGADPDSTPSNSAEARELRAMQRELNKMQTEMAVTKRELDRKSQLSPGAQAPGAPGLALADAPVAAFSASGVGPIEPNADYDTLRKRYDNLLNRQDQLERAQVATAGLDPGVFQIVDMPADAKVPVGPNRWKYRFFGLALALGVALMVAFAVEIPKLYSITDDRDVEYYLGVPVMALIPETVSPVESRSSRLLVGRTVGVLLIAALLVAVFLLLRYPQVFTQFASLLR